MIPLLILISGVSIFEISIMAKQKQGKEIVTFIFFALITLGLGYYYFSNPNRKSIIHWIMDFLRLRF